MILFVLPFTIMLVRAARSFFAPGVFMMVAIPSMLAVYTTREFLGNHAQGIEARSLHIDQNLIQGETKRYEKIARWLKNEGYQWLRRSGVKIPNLDQLVTSDKPTEFLLDDLKLGKSCSVKEILEQKAIPYEFYQNLYELDKGLQRDPNALQRYFQLSPHDLKPSFINLLEACGKGEANLPELCRNGLFQTLLAEINRSDKSSFEKEKLLAGRDFITCKTTVSNSLTSGPSVASDRNPNNVLLASPIDLPQN